MARKKKVEEKIYTPSKYQQAIFDFIEKGQGNCVINACAGSGKSYTLIQSLKLIPSDKRILFCAFNRDIVKELSKKIEKQVNIDIRTVHGLGYAIINRNLDTFVPINENKYRQELHNNFKNYCEHNIYQLGKKNYIKYIENTLKLCDYFRFNIAHSSKDAAKIIKRYDVDVILDEEVAAFKLLEWGKEHLDEIDYTDMIWLPNILRMGVKGFQYDYVMVDECQDLSTAQRELLLRCKKINTRFICVGDSSQAIYGFASADIESFNVLQSMPNTTLLPLSISYRCADKIVDFAHTVVPTIEKNGDNREGEIVYNVELEEINDGDMVLCRNNAPLAKAYSELIGMGKKCFIRGKDIGNNLISILKKIDEDELNINLKDKGVFSTLYYDFFKTRNDIMEKTNLKENEVINDSLLSNKLDTIKSLEILSEGCDNKQQLIDKIKEIFSDKSKEGISLSTIHKAKGLEADKVYIVMPSLMPSKSAKQDWEILQEQNLRYVAYTRAKNKLGFVNEAKFDTLGVGNTESLKNIEIKINSLYSIKKYEKVTINNYKDVLQRIGNKPKPMPTRTNNVTLRKTNNIGLDGAITISNILSKKTTKIKR